MTNYTEDLYNLAYAVKYFADDIYQDFLEFDIGYTENKKVLRQCTHGIFMEWSNIISRETGFSRLVIYQALRHYFLSYCFDTNTGKQGGYINLFHGMGLATPSTRDLMTALNKLNII